MQRKLLIILCLTGSVFISFGQKKKKNKSEAVATTNTDTAKIDYKALGSPMPDIRMLVSKGKTMGSEIITPGSLSKKKNVLVMMFNPTCGHCQDETILFKKHIDAFQQTEMLLIADTVMREYMEFFENVTRASEAPAIKVGLEQTGFINKAFIYKSLPQLNIYDRDRKLVKIFTGDVPIDSLKPYIQ